MLTTLLRISLWQMDEDWQSQAGADPGMGRSGPGPPLLTAKSCRFSLFWGYISSQFRHSAPSFLQILDPALPGA